MEIKAEKLEKLNTTAEEEAPPSFWEWLAAGLTVAAAIAKLISMS